MTIKLQKPDITELKPRITVFGVGGGGGNAVNNMITAGLQGVDFVVANTDAQALTMTKAERIIQLGVNVTEGLGAGSQPEVGRAAAFARQKIESAVMHAHDAVDDSKPEPGALGVGACLLKPCERPAHALDLGLRNARAAIGNLDAGELSDRVDLDVERVATAGIAQGVIDQVGQGAPDR